MAATWSAAMRRMVRQEEARAREKLGRRQRQLKREQLQPSAASGGARGDENEPAEAAAASTSAEGNEAKQEAQQEAEEEEEELEDDYLQKHVLSRESAQWVCLEDAQQAHSVALNRQQTMFAVGEKDGRLSIWDNVALRVITRELDPTSIVLAEDAEVDAKGSGGEQSDSRRSEKQPTGEDDGDEEEEEEEGDDDADANEYSTGNEDASVEAEDDDAASIEGGDASTEEEEEVDAAAGEKDDSPSNDVKDGSLIADSTSLEHVTGGLSLTDLRRARSSLKVVTMCAWSCDSRWIFAGCEEKATRKGVLCVWDVEASTLVAMYNFDAVINCIDAHPTDPNLLIVSSYNALPVLLNLVDRTTAKLDAIPIENESLTISIPNNSRHPNLIVAARYGLSGQYIYAATTKATVAVLDAVTLERLNNVELNVLIQYLDLAVTSAETALLITSSKGLHEFSISRSNEEDNEAPRVTLAEKWLLSTGSVRAPWSLCAFTGDEKFAIGVPVVRHRHVGENGLYTWDRTTGRAQHNAGVKDGVNAVEWDRHRDSLIAASANAALFVFEETFTTTFPGSMYPAGFRLITDNELHHEQFDIEDAHERERADKEFSATMAEELKTIDIFNGSTLSVTHLLPPSLPNELQSLPSVENELLYLPAIPIVQTSALKRSGQHHLFQGSAYHDEKHFGLGQSVFEPLKTGPPKSSKPSGKSKKRKSGQASTSSSGKSGKGGKRASGSSSSQKRRRR